MNSHTTHSNKVEALQSGFSLSLSTPAALLRKTSCEHWSKTLFLFLSSAHRAAFDQDPPEQMNWWWGLPQLKIILVLFFHWIWFLWKVSICLSKYQTLCTAYASKMCGLVQIRDIRVVVSFVFWIYMDPKDMWWLTPSSVCCCVDTLQTADETEDMAASLHLSHTICLCLPNHFIHIYCTWVSFTPHIVFFTLLYWCLPTFPPQIIILHKHRQTL